MPTMSLGTTVGAPGATNLVPTSVTIDSNVADAGAFAASALSNYVHAAAWEFGNEPYLFQGSKDFFTNGMDYPPTPAYSSSTLRLMPITMRSCDTAFMSST